MNQRPPIITFRVSVPATASPDAVYAVLADLSSHLVWTGERAADKNFRLLALEAPPAPATVGDRFSSKGANGFSMTFFDSSVVVEAERGTHFGFETESRLERKHRPTWLARFEHRYTITPSGAGAGIDYTCGVWPTHGRLARWPAGSMSTKPQPQFLRIQWEDIPEQGAAVTLTAMLCLQHRAEIALAYASARGSREVGDACDLCEGRTPRPLE
jgi:hypothetical protein